MSLSTKPLQRSQSLHEQTYQALRDSILSGELSPGERLVETQLAEKLQVSRTPIREAMRQLQREELLTADPNGGLRVIEVSTTDAIHLYECRIALETLAVAGACVNATSAQLATLQSYVAQAELLTQNDLTDSTETINSIKLLDLDHQFHRLIAESSGNKWLVSLLDQVFDKMALLRTHTTRHNPMVLEIRVEHQLIYETIAQRNVEAATKAIRSHLSASKKRVVQEVDHLQQTMGNSVA